MTDEEKREQRYRLNLVRNHLMETERLISKQISDLCHAFTEDDLIDLGYVRSSFSGPYMAYEYTKDKKTVVFLHKSGEVLSYSGSPTKSFNDIQELKDYTG